jgi:iron complex transport system substrate-binding protein
MEKKALIAIVAVIAVIAVGCVAYMLFANPSDPGKDYETDFANKQIEIVDNLDDGIVAVGQDSFRWMTYFGLADKCVMVDMNDMTNYLGKSFMYVGRALVDIEGGDSATLKADDPARAYFTHTNCGVTDEDVATIIDLKPSIVVVPAEFYTDYSLQMAAIERAGIKTLGIGYIYTFLKEDTFEITDDLKKQIGIISKALNQSKRGNELLNAFSYLTNDLSKLRSKITDTKTAYVGALAYNGAHGLDSSIPYHMPMALAGIDNILEGKAVYEGSGVKTYNAADIAANIDDDTILFVDASGYFQNTTNESKGVAKLFQGHEAYIVADYIWTGINYDTIFVSAYQMLMYAYGDDVLTEEQFVSKINKVYDLFYGTHLSNRNISVFSKYSVELPEPGENIFEDMSEFHEVVRGNPVSGVVFIDTEGNLSWA